MVAAGLSAAQIGAAAKFAVTTSNRIFRTTAPSAPPRMPISRPISRAYIEGLYRGPISRACIEDRAGRDRLLSSRRRTGGQGMTGCIVGWAHTKFGKHDGLDVETLIVEVAQGALADAGVVAADIDQVYLGTMNGGLVKQEFPASLVFQADPAFRFKPATRVENACATGSAAIHMGLNAIAAGKARLVLVVG